VLGAAVPEAAVDEDGDAALGEHDVRTDELASHPDWVVLAEAVTQVVEG
jgi:hypothetical protein